MMLDPVIDLRPSYRALPLADGGALVVRDRPGCAPIVECECGALATAVRVAGRLNDLVGPELAERRSVRTFEPDAAVLAEAAA